MGNATWWQRGVIYQIYPRSFMDGDGDGVGDLRGILARLDHLTWLGVDAIWLSPVHPSPWTTSAMTSATSSTSARCSAPWPTWTSWWRPLTPGGCGCCWTGCPTTPPTGTRRSRSRAPRATTPGATGTSGATPGATAARPPTGCATSATVPGAGTSAPASSPTACSWISQPDLNWRNPRVQAAMLDTLRFWLARGVDGFRIDALTVLVEDDRLRDNPPNPHYRPGQDLPYRRELSVWNVDQPETRELAALMREVVDEFGDDRVLLAELGGRWSRSSPTTTAPTAAGSRSRSTSSCQRRLGRQGHRRLRRPLPGRAPGRRLAELVLGNHDISRVASRLGPAQARVAAVLLLTLPGTPILYQGDELGLADVPIPAAQALDPIARLVPGRGRDSERTPMPWDAGPGGGFTIGRPWLPLGAGNLALSVAAQRDDPGSMLALHRRQVRLRRNAPALVGGGYQPVESDGDVLAYQRAALGGVSYLVASTSAPTRPAWPFPARRRPVPGVDIPGPRGGGGRRRPGAARRRGRGAVTRWPRGCRQGVR